MPANDTREIEEAFAAAARQARLLYLAFGGALVTYTLIGFVLQFAGIMPENGGFVFQRNDPTATILMLVIDSVALVIAVVVLFVLAPRRLRVAPTGRDAQSIGDEVYRRTVLMLALLEAPGILGLVLFLISGSIVMLGALVGLSVLLLLLTFPNEQKWRETARSLHT